MHLASSQVSGEVVSSFSIPAVQNVGRAQNLLIFLPIANYKILGLLVSQ